MKIVHIVWSFNYGGIQTMVADLVNQQIKVHSVHLVIINRNISSLMINRISRKVKIHQIGRKSGTLSVLRIIKLNAILHRLSADIIHCHFHNQIKALFFFKKRILHLTIHDVNRPLKHLKSYYHIYSISKAVQKDLLNRGNINSFLVYNGIDVNSIQPKENYKYEVFKIVQVSRLIHLKKGQDIVLRALSYLVNKLNIEKIELNFIGDGESLGFLKQLANDLNVSDKVEFIGHKDRQFLMEHLKDYDLLVQPSRYEGFGITVIEAMVAGLPVLVSDIDGPMEIIEYGKYGYFFRTEDDINCGEQIHKIKAHVSNGEFEQKVNSIRKYVINNFSIQATSKKYLMNYNK